MSGPRFTKEEVYELARKRWPEPAVLVLGEECVLGYWAPNGETTSTERLILRSRTQAVVPVARAKTWDQVADLAGLSSSLEGDPTLPSVVESTEPSALAEPVEPAVTGVYERPGPGLNGAGR